MFLRKLNKLKLQIYLGIALALALEHKVLTQVIHGYAVVLPFGTDIRPVDKQHIVGQLGISTDVQGIVAVLLSVSFDGSNCILCKAEVRLIIRAGSLDPGKGLAANYTGEIFKSKTGEGGCVDHTHRRRRRRLILAVTRVSGIGRIDRIRGVNRIGWIRRGNALVSKFKPKVDFCRALAVTSELEGCAQAPDWNVQAAPLRANPCLIIQNEHVIGQVGIGMNGQSIKTIFPRIVLNILHRIRRKIPAGLVSHGCQLQSAEVDAGDLTIEPGNTGP